MTSGRNVSHPFIRRRYISRYSSPLSFFSSFQPKIHREELCRTRESSISVCLPAMAIKGSIVLAVCERTLAAARNRVRFHEIGRAQSWEGILASPCCYSRCSDTTCICIVYIYKQAFCIRWTTHRDRISPSRSMMSDRSLGTYRDLELDFLLSFDICCLSCARR